MRDLPDTDPDAAGPESLAKLAIGPAPLPDDESGDAQPHQRSPSWLRRANGETDTAAKRRLLCAESLLPSP